MKLSNHMCLNCPFLGSYRTGVYLWLCLDQHCHTTIGETPLWPTHWFPSWFMIGCGNATFLTTCDAYRHTRHQKKKMHSRVKGPRKDRPPARCWKQWQYFRVEEILWRVAGDFKPPWADIVFHQTDVDGVIKAPIRTLRHQSCTTSCGSGSRLKKKVYAIKPLASCLGFERWFQEMLLICSFPETPFSSP